MRSILNGISLGGIFLLSACGGSGSSANDPVVEIDDPIVEFNEYETFAETNTALFALADEVISIQYTDPATLPTSGTAVHTGPLGILLQDGSSAGGEMILRTNFANGSIAGDVGNIIASDETKFSGTLDITNGRIDRGADTLIDFTFSAEMDGRLTSTDRVIEVDAQLDGDYTGENYEYVEGFVGGTVRVNDAPIGIVDGGFVGELR